MDTYKHNWTILEQEIFSLLCVKAGEELSQRDIAKALKVSPTAVSNSIKELAKSNLISIKKLKTINFISFNRNNKRAIQLKRVENLKQIYESGLSDFLYNEFPGCTVIIFGSYSLGEDMIFGEKDDRNSDIDIAIIGTKGKEIDLKVYNKHLEKIVSINFYKSWNEIHKHLKNNILNGIILSGGIDL